MADRNFIKINNNWFNTTENKGDTMINKYSSFGLLIYSLMLENLTLRNTFHFQINDICSILNINNSKNTYMTNKIKKVILQMNNKIYSIHSDMRCKCPIKDTEKIDNSKIYYCKVLGEKLENKFTIIYDDELYNLIELENKHNLIRGSLISQFTYICKNINADKEKDNYKTSFASIKTIAENIGITSCNTVINNNKILCDNKLLLIDNAGIVIKDDEIKNVSNLYARPEDTTEFEKSLEIQKTKVTVVNNNKKEKLLADEQRRLKQKITHHIKNKKLILDDLTTEEWIDLNKIEREYADFVMNTRNKKIRKGTLTTIKLDGTNRECENVKEWLELNNYQTGENGFEVIKDLCKLNIHNKSIIYEHKNKLKELGQKDINRMLYYFYNNIYNKLIIK